MKEPNSEALFAGWLEARERGENPDLESLCGAYPHLAASLRGMRDLHADVDALLDYHAADRIKTSGGVTSESWAEYLDLLSRLGPLPERYTRGEKLAEGGMGGIHDVEDRLLRRRLVVKLMHDDGAGGSGATPRSDDRSLGRFLEEAQVTARLDHPYIVPVHDIGRDSGGRVYFAMKRVYGEDLRATFDKILHGVDNWTTAKGLRILLKVCEAMAYAHAKGVIHRDLKPGNVMVGKYGEVYVMDWGLARILGETDTKDVRIQEGSTASFLQSERRAKQSARGHTPDAPLVTMDGDVVGTPAYMPLEQAEGILAAIDARADIYAVGAMLYQLLAGTMPYVAPGEPVSGRVIWQRVKSGPPRALYELAPKAPAELIAIVEKAMARDAKDRYATMGDLAADLQAYLDVKVVSAYETGAIAELKKWVQRNPALATAAAVLMLVLAGATAIVSQQKAEVESQKAVVDAKNREVEARNQDLSIANEEIKNQKAAVEWQKTEAENAKTRADRERDQVLRLADVKRLEQLRNRQQALWPSFPNNVPGIEQWLTDAKALLARLPEHRTTRDALRDEKALPYTEAEATKDRETHPDAGKLAELREQMAKLEATTPKDADETKQRDEALTKTSESIATLERSVTIRRTYAFSDDADLWQHDVLSDLVSGLEALTAKDPFEVTIESLERRLEDARTIEADSIGKYTKEWDKTIAAIAVDPRYHGLQIPKRLGLVPIGRDQDSGLFEFWHVRSGERPTRDEAGKIKVTDEMGMVFVLVPGGTFFQGAQKADEDGKNYDPEAEDDESDSSGEPVAVTLDSYFISKYEWTQGQWQRLFANNPSQYPAGSAPAGQKITLSHPVESVSWTSCYDATRRVGLALPTEAQWECAARGGSDTRWFFGADKSQLAKYGNIADKTAKKAGVTWNCEMDLDDGYVVHAAVGSFLPNGFGLYDTLGNEYEWCRDGYTNYDARPRSGDGERVVHAPSNRVDHGGSFDAPASLARSANRSWRPPGALDYADGLRPVLPLSDP